jgi:cellulose synthase/poly-beta-1,6-N-acetylglucosamine synthase-like glycosyltransferase
MTILTVLSVRALMANLYILIEVGFGIRKMRTPGNIKVPALKSGPMVSVIVPSRNEEGSIEPALRSLLALDYESILLKLLNDVGIGRLLGGNCVKVFREVRLEKVAQKKGFNPVSLN